MKYQVTVADNNGLSIYGPFDNKREAMKERTHAIKDYRTTLVGTGYERETCTDWHGNPAVIFRHAVYSSMVFTVQPLTD